MQALGAGIPNLESFTSACSWENYDLLRAVWLNLVNPQVLMKLVSGNAHPEFGNVILEM